MLEYLDCNFDHYLNNIRDCINEIERNSSLSFEDFLNEMIARVNNRIEYEIFNEGLLKATSGSLVKLLNYELEIDNDNL